MIFSIILGFFNEAKDFIKKRGWIIMSNGTTFLSYTFAAMAGIFFIKGLAVLSSVRFK